MKTQKPISQIVDHPKSSIWETFYECPSQSRANLSYIVATNQSEQWGCSCPRWIYKREECKHIREVKLHLFFINQKEETIETVKVETLPKSTQKATSRFSLVKL
ncbi:MAG TPA: hypothetical protein DIW23_04780 [Anaerolineae bacterium]|nr:hypothetical protein [Anaerolineae bacterium]